MFRELAEQVGFFGDVWQAMAALASVSALGLVGVQIGSTLKWNKNLASYDVLNGLVNGDFTSLIERLHRDFGWDIVRDPRTYDEVRADFERDGKGDKVVELLLITQRLLRQLEVLFINVDRSIVSEDICRQYLENIVQNIYLKTKGFIAMDRRVRADLAIYREFEKYGKRWSR